MTPSNLLKRQASTTDSDDASPGQIPPLPAEGDASSSDQDIGPMPLPPEKYKKRKTLPHQSTYLAHLPSASRYFKSLMHRDTVTSVTLTRTNFLITTSVDGHVKFWKKSSEPGMGVEFVKHYRAHLAVIVGSSVSADGASFATIAADASVKVFDVVNFDLIGIIKLGYVPRACEWVHRRGAEPVLAVAEEGKGTVRLYEGKGDGTPIETVQVHKQPCHLLAYNERYDCVVSADIGGMIEYWSPSNPQSPPKGTFEYKSTTDLFDFKKSKVCPTTLTLSPDYAQFVTFSIADRQVRLFDFATGKLKRKYDESLKAAQEMQQAGTSIYKLDDMEFGRRLAVERDLDASAQTGAGDAVANATGAGTVNAVFDESGNYLLYPTMLGIKAVNTVTNRVDMLLGKDETMRFLNLSLFQGAPSKKAATWIAAAASENPLLAKQELIDPTLFCTAFKRARFYLMTRLEPDSDPRNKDRDVFNEKPTREEQTIAATTSSTSTAKLASTAILHTTMGDIHLRLFPDLVPKTVENFVGLAKKGYYSNLLFHRIIRKFMIQTGDPLGDGTGGESLWGGNFGDELREELKHDRPYTVSMANAGPGTNGSQFFVTTVPASWLDGKHTVFGRCTAGLDVVHAIENVKCDKSDKPREDIRIINVTIH